MNRNVELKATDPDPAWSRAVCRRLEAEDCGVLWQRDTYFNRIFGRLKLREQRPGPSQLVYYERADETRERESRYWLAAVADAERTRSLLAAADGILAVVEKDRHLFVWRGVRIHLDEVRQLGTFVELEAVAPAESDLSTEHRLVVQLRAELDITDERLIRASYVDELTRC